jgi:hypothetical protein
LAIRRFKFKSKIWKYRGPAAWHFITLPKGLSMQIRKEFGLEEEGWGRLKTVAAIGKTEWKTAIWFDTKAASYLLQVKADVRRREKLEDGVAVAVNLAFSEADHVFVKGRLRPDR